MFASPFNLAPCSSAAANVSAAFERSSRLYPRNRKLPSGAPLSSSRRSYFRARRALAIVRPPPRHARRRRFPHGVRLDGFREIVAIGRGGVDVGGGDGFQSVTSAFRASNLACSAARSSAPSSPSRARTAASSDEATAASSAAAKEPPRRHGRHPRAPGPPPSPSV